MLVGIEHEYTVTADNVTLDARVALPALVFDGARLDPGDPNAVRLATGGVITADGREFEVATPPVPYGPNAANQLVAHLAAGRRALVSRLHAVHSVAGYSTHVNLSVDDDEVAKVAWLMLCRFGSAIMLLLDAKTSPGLLVRPRRGRLELCGEYCDGDELAVVVTLAVGATRACRAAIADRGSLARLPPAVMARVQPAHARFGWYLDRQAFGSDLYRRGRSTPLRRGRRVLIAHDHLRRCWEAARPFVEADTSPRTLAGVDAVVDSADLPRADVPPVLPDEHPDHGWRQVPAEGRLVVPVTRPGFVVRAVVATWDVNVFEVVGARRVFCSVKGPELAEFLDRLSDGALDAQLAQATGDSLSWVAS